VALALATIGLVASASAADAHALLKSSVPAAGTSVGQAPASVLLTFTEAPDPKLSSVSVIDSTGRTVSQGAAQPVPGNPNQLRIALSSVGNGAYTVNWRTVSKVDGHVTGSSFSFGVGETPPAGASTGSPGTVSSSQSESPSALSVIGKWTLYWGLALLVGAATVSLVVVRGRVPPGGRMLLAVGWGVAALGLILSILAEQHSIGVSLGDLFGSSTGQKLLLESVALAATGGAVAFAAVRPSMGSAAAVGVGAGVTMWFHAAAGHADAASSLRWGNLLVQWAHLVAVGAWIGGLVWLLLSLRGVARGERTMRAVRFSRMAVVALGAVVLTGVLRAISEVGGFGRLFDTSFGITLVVKSCIVAVLIALGALNRFRNVPKLRAGDGTEGTLRRTVRAEIGVAAAVFVAAAILSGLPPSTYAAEAAGATGSQAPTSVTATGSDFATTVRVRLTATPGTVGANAFVAQVADYDTGKPVPARSVSLGFSYPGRADLGTSTLALKKAVAGRWEGAGTNLSIDGRWNVDVVVQTATSGVDVPLHIETRLPPQQVTVSRQKGQPTLYTVALPAGRSLQAYVDPGARGQNTVHFTFFQSSGNEQPISSAHGSALTPSGSSVPLKLIRFDPGHFGSNVRLGAGRWTFLIQATTPDDNTLSAYFNQTIPR
jgi:copper transport protein